MQHLEVSGAVRYTYIYIYIYIYIYVVRQLRVNTPFDSLGSKILLLRSHFVFVLFCLYAVNYRRFSRDVIG